MTSQLVQKDLNKFKMKMIKIFDEMSTKEDNLQNDIDLIANSLDNYKTNNFLAIKKEHR